MKSYTRNLLLVFGFSLLASFIFFSFVLAKICVPYYFFVLTFIAFITYLSNYTMMQSFKKNPKLFFSHFMLATASKLGIFLVFIIAYIWFYRSSAIAFVIYFFINYILFTIIEITYLVKETTYKK